VRKLSHATTNGTRLRIKIGFPANPQC
jgi:hypothetical protein